MTGHDRNVDEAHAIFFVSDVPFLFEHAQHRTHGRVSRRVLHALAHFGSRRLPALVEDVHDLPLAAAQSTRCAQELASC